MYRETASRSVAKTVSWRLWATLTTVALVFLFTGHIEAAVAIGATEVVLKMALYFGHERIWNLIPFGRYRTRAAVVWFTGLPSSGKSTLAKALVEKLQKEGESVQWLDGDVLRAVLPSRGYTRQERDRHVKEMGIIASLLEKNGTIVVASFISPYEEARQFVRAQCNNFVEVYVSTPVTVCEERDVKGLYKKARAGDVQNFTGISDPYEPPQNPEITINTTELTVEECIDEIYRTMRSHRNLPPRLKDAKKKEAPLLNVA